VPPAEAANRTPGQDHHARCYRDAWEDVDLPSTGTAPTEITVDPAMVRAAIATEPTDGWLSTLRQVLRPVKPMIAPIAAAALPVIARTVARRRR
jgi:hypothetical protein